MDKIIITVGNEGYTIDKCTGIIHTYTFFYREDVDIVKYINYYTRQNYAVEVHY